MGYDKGGTAWCSNCRVLVVPVRFSTLGEPFCGEGCQRKWEAKTKAEILRLTALLRECEEVANFYADEGSWGAKANALLPKLAEFRKEE